MPRNQEEENGTERETVDAFEFLSRGRNSKSAKMVVGKDAIFYKMDHKVRGVALIFNHENFRIPNLGVRTGTQADEENLKSCLKPLGFEIIVHKDLSANDLDKEVNRVAGLNHSDYDCFLMCVLTHGEEGILFAKDVAYKPDTLWKPFTADKCKSLAGKPKLFFIQACQGSNLDSGVTMRTETDSGSSYKIPVHSDFLFAYSTIPGFYSWRNTTKGSWFIQSLCLELKQNMYHFDILTLLTFVNRRVATEFESNVPNNCQMHGQKQIPCISYMLTRLLKFTPKNDQHI